MSDRVGSQAVCVAGLLRTLPSERSERWAVLRRFFEGWYGQLRPEDGCPPESIRFMRLLARRYR